MLSTQRVAIRAALLAAAVWLPASQAIGQTRREVRFQVTTADGAVRDLPLVPDHNKGITSVRRVTRIVPAGQAYDVLSTHGRPIRSINRGQTRVVALRWNGAAWVGPAAAAATPADAPRASTRPAEATMTPGRRAEILKIEVLLSALRRLEGGYAGKLGQAKQAVTAATAEADKIAALQALAKVKFAHDNCTRAIAQAEARLADLLAGRAVTAAAPSPGGTVLAAPRTPRGMGVIRPVEDSAVLPHRVQVWPLKPAKGLRTYRISMAHAEAGVYGAFHYVAYADTTGDGTPDTLIARSPLACANRRGGWTVWTFQTEAQRVFVGNTWRRDDTTQFSRKRTRFGKRGNWSGLPDEVYVSGFFGKMPTKRHRFWPYLHNIRVQLHEHAPRRHRRGGESEIIIRERP